MKTRIRFYFLVLLIASISQGYAQNKPYPHLIQYLNPLPGAQYVSPSTNIIVRLSEPVDKKTIASNEITIKGSLSGFHTGHLIVSDDNRTMIVQPTFSFFLSESVTITLNKGINVQSGSAVGTYEYSFAISSRSMSNTIIKSSIERELEEIVSKTRSVNESPALISKTGYSLPSDFPDIALLKSNDPSPGFLFLSNVTFLSSNITNTPYLMILDNFCNPVFYQKMDGICFDFKSQPDGLLTYWNGIFEEIDNTHTIKNEYACGHGYSTDPHELRFFPNGHALLLGTDVQSIDMTPIDSAGHVKAQVIGLIIQELDLQKKVVFEWRSWDHFKITDATHIDFSGETIDYVHGNALEIDFDGNILLSSRHMDEITKIDRETGEIIWRLGGKNNQFTFINDSIGFSHQHSIRRIKNGNITMFDNGNYHVPHFSRAVEYSIDEKNKTATLIWQYRNSPDYFGNALGYVQRLDNGNTLISWGATSPAVTEVKPDGSKAFEMALPDGVFSYRAYRSDWSVVTKTENTPTLPTQFALNQNYPNPFNPTTMITYQLGSSSLVSLKIYDVVGREIATLLNQQQTAGEYHVSFNASTLSSGVYFYRLNAGNHSAMKKMVLLK